MTGGISNQYLETTASTILPKNFIGVFPCDYHPTITRNNFSIIFNTGNSKSKGEHFVCIMANKHHVYYFDPFGMEVNNAKILQFIKKIQNGRKIYFNSSQIQDFNSSFCGFYCLAFLMSVYKKIPFHNFLSSFNREHLKNNDKKVIVFICKFLRK